MKRSQVNRSDRLGEEIRSRIAEIIPSLKDPRVTGLISITRVDVSGDCRYATVFVSLLGDKSELAQVVKGLRSSAGYVRHELALALQLRYTPELRFEPDAGIVQARETLDKIKDIKYSEQEASSEQL